MALRRILSRLWEIFFHCLIFLLVAVYIVGTILEIALKLEGGAS